MTVQTGLRIGEVYSLTLHDIHLGTSPRVTCTGNVPKGSVVVTWRPAATYS